MYKSDVNAVTENGKPITSQLVDQVLKDESKNIKGANETNVRKAVEYLSSQVKSSWPSDFLTSDLQHLLDGTPKSQL